MQVADRDQTQIGRDLVSGLQQDDVSRHEFPRIEVMFAPFPHNHSLRGHRTGQRVYGLERLGLLKEPGESIDERDAENHRTVNVLTQQERNRRSGHQDVDQRSVELQEKPHEGPARSGRSQQIGAVLRPALPHLVPGQPELPVNREGRQHLRGRQLEGQSCIEISRCGCLCYADK